MSAFRGIAFITLPPTVQVNGSTDGDYPDITKLYLMINGYATDGAIRHQIDNVVALPFDLDHAAMDNLIRTAICDQFAVRWSIFLDPKDIYFPLAVSS